MRKFDEDIAERFQLPPEAVENVPCVTLSGSSRVLVENHRGLLEYTSELIDINAGRGLVRVKGEGLLIRAMDRRQILVSGRISGVDLE